MPEETWRSRRVRWLNGGDDLRKCQKKLRWQLMQRREAEQNSMIPSYSLPLAHFAHGGRPRLSPVYADKAVPCRYEFR